MEPTDHNLRAFEAAHRRRLAPPALPEALEGRFGDLAGARILHVGCGDGAMTAALADLGALVTGLDEDAELLEAARLRDSAAVFLLGNVDELPAELRRGRFDLVLASLRGVRDVRAWAAGLAAALQPGGSLLVHADHPALAYDYFDPGVVRVGDLVTAIAAAPDLRLRSLEELPASHHRVQRNPRVPGELVLVADKAVDGPR